MQIVAVCAPISRTELAAIIADISRSALATTNIHQPHGVSRGYYICFLISETGANAHRLMCGQSQGTKEPRRMLNWVDRRIPERNG